MRHSSIPICNRGSVEMIVFFCFTSVIIYKIDLCKYEGVVLSSCYQLLLKTSCTIFAGRKYKCFMLNVRETRTGRAVESVTDTGYT